MGTRMVRKALLLQIKMIQMNETSYYYRIKSDENRIILN